MRPSPLRHPLAILRKITDLTQKQLADLAECSRPTIQAIELRKLALSENLAQRIAYQTGVCPGWLLSNNVSQKPTRGDGSAFTKETFESERASLLHPVLGIAGLEAIRLEMITAVERLASSASSAYKTDKIWLWTYKVEAALESLEKQFGIDKAINRVGAACYPDMKKRRPVVQPIIDKWSDELMANARTKSAQAQKSVQSSKRIAKWGVKSTKAELAGPRIRI
jgi:DNA-binding XRE family transcriptional regulator